MTDSQLLKSFVTRRDEAAFESLVLRHGPMVLRVCCDLLADPHEAEDAFQAVFLVLVRNAGSIRDGDSLGRWLYGTACRVALRAKTRAARRRTRERQVVAMAVAAPDFDADRRELRPLLHAELRRLPERFRDPLILCYLEGLTQGEAAGRLGCPLATLKSRLARGREILRGRLARRGVAVSLAILILRLAEGGSNAVPSELVRTTVRAGVLAAEGGQVAGTVSSRAVELAEQDRTTLPRVTLRMAGVIALAILIVAEAGAIASQSGLLKAAVAKVRRAAARSEPSCGGTAVGVAIISPEPEPASPSRVRGDD